MPTRVVYQNRTVWRSNDFHPINWRRGKPERITGRGATREVTPVDCTIAIAPTDARSPFRAGIGVRDSDEDLVYRVIDYVPPTGGWASTDFWQDRYRLRHEDIIELARFGFLDAAIEANSQVRRYRCRDELRMKSSKQYKTINKLAQHRRHNAKRAKMKRGQPWASD